MDDRDANIVTSADILESDVKWKWLILAQLRVCLLLYGVPNVATILFHKDFQIS